MKDKSRSIIHTSSRGLWAVKWSFIGLAITAILQVAIFCLFVPDSVALITDMIHNIGDAMTSIPLAASFLLARRQFSRNGSNRYDYLKDLAGVGVVGLLLFTTLVVGYQSWQRFLHPQPLTHAGALSVAAIVGFIGNELVALFRIRVGKEINSAVLIADGYHARADGLVSLSLLLSAIGVWLGYSWIDPLLGLLITLMLLHIVWESAGIVGLTKLSQTSCINRSISV
jgi:cation diffusion facilitator family transporter